ncbi:MULTISPECIES: hypothetical protein [unclassified Xanthobacter]|uniref:hypothetical protein n=1 Tax=unclassified Xanthobacter TaxID=2623496 RepID=UPI001F2367C5|nr:MULTISPECIES: hypothetical protein [unclassified Xanthobacter]
MKRKLKDAIAATDLVQDMVGKALDLLQPGFSGRIVKGYGVYDAPAAQRAALREALKHLNEAIQRLDVTSWPTNVDYDRLERRCPSGSCMWCPRSQSASPSSQQFGSPFDLPMAGLPVALAAGVYVERSQFDDH